MAGVRVIRYCPAKIRIEVIIDPGKVPALPKGRDFVGRV